MRNLSHAVMCKCKVRLIAANTVFGVRHCGSPKSLIFTEYWANEVFGLPAFHYKIAEHILPNSPYNSLAIHLAGFSAKFKTMKLRLMIAMILIFVRGEISLSKNH